MLFQSIPKHINVAFKSQKHFSCFLCFYTVKGLHWSIILWEIAVKGVVWCAKNIAKKKKKTEYKPEN